LVVLALVVLALVVLALVAAGPHCRAGLVWGWES